ncbi:hypothetical protein D3C86_2185980 [compost metagenome]
MIARFLNPMAFITPISLYSSCRVETMVKRRVRKAMKIRNTLIANIMAEIIRSVI